MCRCVTKPTRGLTVLYIIVVYVYNLPQLLDVTLDGGGDDPVVVPDLLDVQVEGAVVEEVHEVEEAPRFGHLLPVQGHHEAPVVVHVLRFVRQLIATEVQKNGF